MRAGVAIAWGLLSVAFASPVLAQPLPALVVDPLQPGATPHWTISIGASYCGGYKIGDGVYVSPEPPLALPSSIPDGSVLFAGQPGAIDWVNGTLRIGPGPGLVQSMICMAGQRQLNVELLESAGFVLPTDPGNYALDVWTGADPTPVNLPFTVPSADEV
jgi:hypothetical protein